MESHCVAYRFVVETVTIGRNSCSCQLEDVVRCCVRTQPRSETRGRRVSGAPASPRVTASRTWVTSFINVRLSLAIFLVSQRGGKR